MSKIKAKPSATVYCPRCLCEAVPISGTKGQAWMCWDCNHGWRIKEDKAEEKASSTKI